MEKITVAVLLVLLLAGGACFHLGPDDIRGEWSFQSGSEKLYVFMFIGSREKGTLVEVDYPDDGAGRYTVAGKEITFDFVATLAGGRSCHFSGTFTAEDRIAGTMELVAAYPPFAWTYEVEGQRLF